MDYTDHAVLDDQRDRDERVDPALAQHRAEQLDLREVRRKQRRPELGDLARHAGADRDGHRPLDLGSHPDGRSEVQGAVVLDEEDRGAVCFEHLDDAGEQRA
jgi:hypothetical protein